MNRILAVSVVGLLVAACTGGDDDRAPTEASPGATTAGSAGLSDATAPSETTVSTETTESTVAPSTTEPAPPPAPPIAALTIEPVFDVADRWLGSAWSPDGASIVALEGLPGPNGATFAIVRMDTAGTVVQQTPFDHRFGPFPELVGPDGSELLLSNGPNGCTMQPFDIASFTLGAATSLPNDLCSGQYDWDQTVPGVVWAAEQRERVLHRLDGTTGVDTPIPLDTVVGSEYQITWLVLYDGAVYVSFIPNLETPTGPDGAPLPDLVVRVDQSTLVPEAPREIDGRVGVTGGQMVLLGAGGILAELDPTTLEPVDEAIAATRPPIAWGVLKVDTVAWTVALHGDAVQVVQRNPETSRVVAAGQTLSGFGDSFFVGLSRFTIGRDLYVLASDDQIGVASRMWRVAPAPDATLVPDVRIADYSADGTTSTTTTSTTPPQPGADASMAERLADLPGAIQAAASPDGNSLVAVTRDSTQTGTPSTLVRIDGAGAVTHNVPLEASRSVSQVVVTPTGTWLLSRSVDPTNGNSICQLQQLDTGSMALGASVTLPASRNCGAAAFDRDTPGAPLWLTQYVFGRELFTVDPATATVTPVSASASVPPGYTVSSVVATGTSASLILVNDRDEATNRSVTAPDGSALPPLVLEVDPAGAITGPELLDPDDPPSTTPTVPGATQGAGVLWTVGPAVDGAFEIRQHDVETGDVVATATVATQSFDPSYALRTVPVGVGDQLYVLVSGFDQARTFLAVTEMHRVTATT